MPGISLLKTAYDIDRLVHEVELALKIYLERTDNNTLRS